MRSITIAKSVSICVSGTQCLARQFSDARYNLWFALPDMTTEIDSYLAGYLRGEADRDGEAGWPLADHDHSINAVWERIQYHGIAGLLAARMAGATYWPGPLANLILQEARVQAFWEESHRGVLANLIEGLASAGVPSLLMKGSALAYSAYLDPSVRRRGDSDLLIRQHQLDLAREQLAAQGFFPRQRMQGLFFQETWLFDTGIGIIHAVDLHWQVNDSPLIQTALVVDEFFASSCPLPRFSARAAMPSLALTFLQGAINQVWHSEKGYFVEGERLAGAGRLIWAYDNHLLAEQFAAADWEELTRLAVTRGMSPICLEAFALAQVGFQTSLPIQVLDALRKAPQCSDLADHIRQTNRFATFFADLSAIPSWHDKWNFICGHAFPDASHLRGKYPECPHWPIPLLRLRRLAEGAWLWARSP